MNRLPLLLAATATLGTCLSAFGWTQGSVAYTRAHEEITYQAVQGVSGFAAPSAGEIASVSTNPLLMGNFAGDFPFASFKRFKDLYEPGIRELYGVDSPNLDPATRAMLVGSVENLLSLVDIRGSSSGITSDGAYQASGKTQSEHFLRDFGSGVESATKSCNAARSTIQYYTSFSISSRHENDSETPQALKDYYAAISPFYAGVALHIIQDGFSPAHVKRTGADLRQISDLCLYAVPASAGLTTTACRHEEIDARDFIWNLPVEQMNFAGDLFGYMKPEAVAAVQASRAYLNVLNHLYAVRDGLYAQMPKAPPTTGLSVEQFEAAMKQFNEAAQLWATNTTATIEAETNAAMTGYFEVASGPGTGMFKCP